MPYVNIKVTREGVTQEHKERLIRGVTALLVEVLNKDPNATMVVIDEIDTDNWGFRNESVTTLRKEASQKMIPTVIITGASSGMGLALARSYAADGANLVLCARDERKLSRRFSRSRVRPGWRWWLVTSALCSPSTGA